MSSVLEVKNAVRKYVVGNQNIYALNDVSINIKKGEFVSITGKSGSGKSTLMHLIGLLDTPTSGEILLNGKKTKGLTDKKLAQIRNKEIGFVFQSFNLLKRTSAVENVMLPLMYSKVPKSEHKPKALKLLELVGLADRADNKSNELSGGQKQRVAIARALVNDPSIILADEPTGNLDSKTEKEILDIFRKLNKEGKTIIVVTHDEDIANAADRQIVLKDGKLLK